MWASQMVLVVKNPSALAGVIRNTGSDPGSGRSPGGGRSDPLQYSHLETPTDTGAWQVTESDTIEAIQHTCTWDVANTEMWLVLCVGLLTKTHEKILNFLPTDNYLWLHSTKWNKFEAAVAQPWVLFIVSRMKTWPLRRTKSSACALKTF